jgi:hypothetical protein
MISLAEYTSNRCQGNGGPQGRKLKGSRTFGRKQKAV